MGIECGWGWVGFEIVRFGELVDGALEVGREGFRHVAVADLRWKLWRVSYEHRV